MRNDDVDIARDRQSIKQKTTKSEGDEYITEDETDRGTIVVVEIGRIRREENGPCE